MKRILMINLCLLCWLTAVMAESTGVGGPGAILRYDLGARARAVAGTAGVLVGDDQAMAANPSTLALIRRLSVSTGYILLPGSGDFTQMTITLPLGAFHFPDNEKSTGISSRYVGALGFYLTRLVTAYDIEARQTDSVNPDYFFQDQAGVYAMALGLPINHAWGWGLTLKGLYHLLDQEDAHGWGLDGGIYWQGLPGLTAAVAVKDGFSSLYWTTGHWERVLARFNLAVAYTRQWSLLGLTVQTMVEKEWSPAPLSYGVALEGMVYQHIALRAGYNGTLAFGAGLTWPSFGWGHADLTLDYTVAEDRIVDWDHWISLKLTF